MKRAGWIDDQLLMKLNRIFTVSRSLVAGETGRMRHRGASSRDDDESR